ncbi:hypothetical protein COB18_00645 [Candidatus Kaiserbacteria bacterium]|nr:MAG: hypothetical protein COB80_00520 [Candidatus Kaiserbacteria bacterium]PCI90573.1 MAG: hypothetical protein COB18_00645 [Candidatus Kaiserbacteria bacterium]
MHNIITRKRARAVALVLHKAEQQAVGVLLIGILALAFLYVYFVGTAVLHVVERREVQQSIAQEGSRVADLEVSYFKKKGAITFDAASSRNLQAIADKSYFERARYLGHAEIR